MANSLAQFLELGENANKFHPDAVKQYRELVSKLQGAADLTSITDEDVRAYLNDTDYQNYLDIRQELIKELDKNRLTAIFTIKNYASFNPWTYGFQTLLERVSGQKILQNYLEKEQSRAYQDKQRKDWEWQEAQAEHQAFVDKIQPSIDSLKARLAKEKKPRFDDYPGWLKPYKPSVWCNLYSPPKDWMTIKMQAKVLAQIFLLLEALRPRVDYKLTRGAWYVPGVRYELVSPPPSPHSKGHAAKPGTGVPCLRWHMATYILTTAEFWLTDGIISDERYGWTLDITITSECLGKAYSEPTFWEYQDAFVTPLSLLALLAQEKGELPGVDVVKIDKPWTTYRISGFPDDVSLHEDFRHFIQDMAKNGALGEVLLDRGMCDKETAQLVTEKLAELQKPSAPATVPGTTSEAESTGDPYTDVFSALVGLGYTKGEATKAATYVCQKSPDETLANKITTALQYLSQ